MPTSIYNGILWLCFFIYFHEEKNYLCGIERIWIAFYTSELQISFETDAMMHLFTFLNVQ